MTHPTDPPSTDRRRAPRYEILAQVSFRRVATTYVLDVANVSLSGLFVRAPDEKALRRVQVAEKLTLDLFTEEDLQNIRVTARVVRIVGDGPPSGWGFGLEFTDLDDATRAEIERLVDWAAANPPHPPPLPPEAQPFVVAEPDPVEPPPKKPA